MSAVAVTGVVRDGAYDPFLVTVYARLEQARRTQASRSRAHRRPCTTRSSSTTPSRRSRRTSKEATPGAAAWLFAKVPEPRRAKNRARPDLVAQDRPAEVARLVELGATVLDEHDEFGIQWTVLRDVEGNEFCVATAH